MEHAIFGSYGDAVVSALIAAIVGLFMWNFKRGTAHEARIAVLEAKIDGVPAKLKDIFNSQKETCERLARLEGKLDKK